MVSGLAASLQSASFDTRLAAASGGSVHIDGTWRPVIGLGEGRMRGGLLNLSVKLEDSGGSLRLVSPEQLNSVEVERIDLAGIEHGLAALTPAEASDSPPIVILPIAWSTARSSRARKRLLRLAAKAQTRLRMIPVAELIGVEASVPPSVLREGAAALRPLFRGVFVRMAPRKAPIAQLVDCGLSGAGADAGDLAETEGEKAMLRTVLQLQRIGPNVILHKLRSVAALTAARAAGASWASLDLQRSGWHVAQAAAEAWAAEPA